AGVGGENVIAIFRGAFFREQRLLDRIERAAALAAGAGAADADGRDAFGDQNKNQMAEKKIKQVGNNRQHGEENQNILSPVAVGQKTPHRGERRAGGVAGGKNQSDGDRGKAQLREIDREDDAQIGKGESAHAARGHQHQHVALPEFRAGSHRPAFALRYLSRSRSSSVLMPSACSASFACSRLALAARAGGERVSKTTVGAMKKVRVVSGVSLTFLSPPRMFLSPQAPAKHS